MVKKLIYTVFFLAMCGGGYYYYTLHSEDISEYISSYLESGTFPTLEVRYSAQAIMDEHKQTLLKDDYHRYLTPELHFYPYMLMEVKYSTKQNTTAEGIILWDLEDAEFVTSTATWEKTHGFEDCIAAKVDQHDFKIINTIAAQGGRISRKDLAAKIHVEHEILDRWLESCHRKKLVVQTGNDIRLHLERPRLAVNPETTIAHPLVTQNIKEAKQRTRRYSPKQITKIAYLAFGSDFTIRKATEIYLPVYKIDVQNPDGSTHTTYWNALTGQQISNLHTIL